MRKRTRLWIMFIAICIFLGRNAQLCYADEQDNAPKKSELYAKAAVLMDADSGRILYEKNSNLALANASTTKILTCILALEYGNKEDEVTISRRAASAPKVHLGMKEGQRFYMKDLLYALMLESYNDCAIAIAEHIAGSVEDFAKIMNQKAKEIGCQDTYFITPNGLDGTDENGFHHTTARDLGLLMRYCVMQSQKREEFRTLTATRNHCFYEIDSGRSYTVTNRNAFLDMMEGVFSGKTGFTGNAGYCYVGALNRDDRTYIVALLACGWPNNRTYKWSDSRKLLQYGINYFKKVNLNDVEIDLKQITPVLVEGGQGDMIGANPCVDIYIGNARGSEEVLLAEEEEVRVIYKTAKRLQAPVSAHSCIGEIVFMAKDEILLEYEVLTSYDVPAIDYKWCIKRVMELYLVKNG